MVGAVIVGLSDGTLNPEVASAAFHFWLSTHNPNPNLLRGKMD
jgi:hypothetical protein